MKRLAPLTAQEYVALREAVGWGTPGVDVVAPALAQTVAWAVERDPSGRLVGMARAVGDGIYLLLVDVVVHPEAQRRGLGRRLVQDLLIHPAVTTARHTTLFAAPDVAPFHEALGLAPQDGTHFRRERGWGRSFGDDSCPKGQD